MGVFWAVWCSRGVGAVRALALPPSARHARFGAGLFLPGRSNVASLLFPPSSSAHFSSLNYFSFFCCFTVSCSLCFTVVPCLLLLFFLIVVSLHLSMSSCHSFSSSCALSQACRCSFSCSLSFHFSSSVRVYFSAFDLALALSACDLPLVVLVSFLFGFIFSVFLFFLVSVSFAWCVHCVSFCSVSFSLLRLLSSFSSFAGSSLCYFPCSFLHISVILCFTL